MGKAQRSKGARGELLWRDFLREHLGCTDAQRGARNGCKSGEDVINGIPGTRSEVKFVERLNVRSAMGQAISDSKDGDVAYVAHKISRGEWLFTLRAKDLMRLARCLAAIEGRPIYPMGADDGNED